MANIIDYLKWRGDLSFKNDPFNEVDNLILCQLTYTDFSCVPEIDQGFVSIKDAHKKYFELYPEEEVRSRSTFLGRSVLILDDLVQTKRYENMKIGYYRNFISKDQVGQFVAVTYMIDDLVYIVFGGTDHSLVGWKEDFYFSYTSGTMSQLMAVEYLKEMAALVEGEFYLGGHSKGGNLAIYALLFADEAIRSRIKKVYANDSPGFTNDLAIKEDIKKIKEKISLFVPQSSVVGLLMEHTVKAEIVRADAKLIYQHDPLSWQLIGNAFIREDQLSNDAIFVNKALNQWIEDVPLDKRKEAVDGVFYCLEAAKAATFIELHEGGLNSVKEVLQASKTLPKSQYDLIVSLIGKFISQSKDLFIENILDSVAQKKSSIQERLGESLPQKNKN